MLRLFVCGCVMALIPAACPAANTDSGVEPEFVLEFREVTEAARGKVAALYREVEERLDPTKPPPQELLERLQANEQAIFEPAVRRVGELVRDRAEDPDAVQLLVWLASQHTDKRASQTARTQLVEHHLTHRETVALATRQSLSGKPESAEMLLAQLASDSLSDELRGKAAFAYARFLYKKSILAQSVSNSDEEVSERFRKHFGAEYVEELASLDPAEIERESVAWFERVLASHADLEYREGITFGDLAESSIFAIRHLRVGKPAPEIVGEDLNGEPMRLSDFRGRVVLLSFWATWCGPCMAEVPHKRELVEEYDGRPFAVVGVNGDPDRESLGAVLTEHEISWPSFWSGPKGPLGPIPMAWNVNSWPTTYVIDHEGVIRGKSRTNAELIAELVAAAEER